jgi:hypothetical protein
MVVGRDIESLSRPGKKTNKQAKYLFEDTENAAIGYISIPTIILDIFGYFLYFSSVSCLTSMSV